MINLNKEEIILLLYKIREDPKHFEKYLFYKLQYFYARRSQEITTLKVNNIDFITNGITFHIAKKKQKTTLTLAMIQDIAKDIKKIIEDKKLNDDDFLFLRDSNEENFKRNMRTYLERNSTKLIEEITKKENIKLNTHDFRRLRGQHLYLAGNNIEIIQKLYYHKSVDQTLDYLQIHEIEVNKMLLEDINYNI
jgi:integrase